MNIKKLKEYLADVPDDYEVEFGKFMSFDKANDDLADYTIIFDLPIIGLAQSESDKHARFILAGAKEDFESFGATIINFEESIN